MAAGNRTEVTFRYERWRAVTSGIIETAGNTFLLLIAVRWFQAGAVAKALVAAAGAVGLMLSPWVVSAVEKVGWPTAVAASRLSAIGAGAFAGIALVPRLPLYVLGSVAGMAAFAAAVPLVIQIYQENYPTAARGRLFSRTVMIRIATAAGFSELAGHALSANIGRFRWLLLVFAGAFAFASHCFGRCPSRPLAVSGGTHPFRALRFVRQDRLFRQTLICWMLVGFVTLMMNPLRIEYLANPRYGLALNVSRIALVTLVIPNVVRLACSPFWGWLFDRINFFVLRIGLNLGFALAILTFFTSHELEGLLLASMLYGVCNAGGDVAWSLWVTKFAPPDRVADYMSVHTFFTGVRGVLAPLLGFQIVAGLSMAHLGSINAALILAASLLLVPEIKFGRTARHAIALLDEVSE